MIWSFSVQELSNVALPREDGCELGKSLSKVYMSARVTLKNASLYRLWRAHLTIIGGQPTCDSGAGPRGGTRGALVSGGDAVRGGGSRGNGRVGLGHGVERGVAVTMRSHEGGLGVAGPLRAAPWPSIRHNIPRGLR